MKILISLLLITFCFYPTIGKASSPQAERANTLAEMEKYKDEFDKRLSFPLSQKKLELFTRLAKVGISGAQNVLVMHYTRQSHFPAERKRDYAYGDYKQPGTKDHSKEIQKTSALEAYAWLAVLSHHPEFKKQQDTMTPEMQEGFMWTGMGVADMMKKHPEWHAEADAKAQHYYEQYLIPFYPDLTPVLKPPFKRN